jgi:hypothetical protein
MKLEPERSSEVLEVAVGREDGEVSSHSERTDHEIGVRALDPTFTTSVVGGRSFLVVDGLEFEIWERAQMIAQLLKLRFRLNSREQFLAHWPDHDYAAFVNELSQFARNCIVDPSRSAER